MARKARIITDELIRTSERFKPKSKVTTHPDSDQRGLYIRVNTSGSRSFYAVTRDLNRKLVWSKLKSVLIAEARVECRGVLQKIVAGESLAGPQSFEKVANDWFKRKVEEKGLRSKDSIRRYLDKHILPAFGRNDFLKVRRIDISKLHDHIAENNGTRAADLVLGYVKNICDFYALKHEGYVNPVIKGMQRHEGKSRERILGDDELRALWKAAEANGTFGAFVRIALLTAQRRDKIATMKWDDLTGNMWTIPADEREKTNAERLELPKVAFDIINAQPRIAGNPFVFVNARGGGHIRAFDRLKQDFLKRLGTPDADWTLHDLRRTAKSLMSRADVLPHISERVLGHTIKGVEGVYDRHDYSEQKADALRKLTRQIEVIVVGADGEPSRTAPSKWNVVAVKGKNGRVMTDELIKDWMLGDARDRLTQAEREMFFAPSPKRHLTPWQVEQLAFIEYAEREQQRFIRRLRRGRL